jgi:predicted RNA binding protein YcfA (HicA-like mRNA interferase family)
MIIPVHGNRDLPIGTLKGILKDARLTEDDIL